MHLNRRVLATRILAFCCLANGWPSCLAATATQPATAPAPMQAGTSFELDPSGYPAGITSAQAYEQSLAKQLRDISSAAARPAGPDTDAIDASLRVASFALIRATEPDLTRTWLWRQPQASPQTVIRALDIASRAIAHAERLMHQSKDAVNNGKGGVRIQILSVLLVMERALLLQTDPAGAFRAAQTADAVLSQIPEHGQATWNLLIAGCLDQGNKKDDARLRLQTVLREHENSPERLVASILQVRILARTGNYAGAVALVSESLQALSASADKQMSAPVESAPRETNSAQLNPRLAQNSLLMLKAGLLREWAGKLEKTAATSDRTTANDLRQQAAQCQAQADQSGPPVVRLAPLLQTLE